MPRRGRDGSADRQPGRRIGVGVFAKHVVASGRIGGSVCQRNLGLTRTRFGDQSRNAQIPAYSCRNTTSMVVDQVPVEEDYRSIGHASQTLIEGNALPQLRRPADPRTRRSGFAPLLHVRRGTTGATPSSRVTAGHNICNMLGMNALQRSGRVGMLNAKTF